MWVAGVTMVMKNRSFFLGVVNFALNGYRENSHYIITNKDLMKNHLYQDFTLW
jgi:hypothetical protein